MVKAGKGTDCGTGINTTQMKQAATYAGWDSGIWNIVEGSYPTLKNAG